MNFAFTCFYLSEHLTLEDLKWCGIVIGALVIICVIGILIDKWRGL